MYIYINIQRELCKLMLFIFVDIRIVYRLSIEHYSFVRRRTTIDRYIKYATVIRGVIRRIGLFKLIPFLTKDVWSLIFSFAIYPSGAFGSILFRFLFDIVRYFVLALLLFIVVANNAILRHLKLQGTIWVTSQILFVRDWLASRFQRDKKIVLSD